MAAFDNMKSILSKLQIYDLSPDSYINHELSAYSAGFEYVEKMIDLLLNEMFIVTAEDYGLGRWEKILFGNSNDDVDTSDRRKIIMSALQIDENWFTPKSMSKALGAIGIEADLEEIFDEERIIVKANEYRGQNLSYEYIQNQLETILPAHLDITLDMGVFSWAIFDSHDLDFDMWDGFDLSCDELENDGQDITVGG